MAGGGISTTGGLLLLHPASATSANPSCIVVRVRMVLQNLTARLLAWQI
jgi:hypothetical protein